MLAAAAALAACGSRDAAADAARREARDAARRAAELATGDSTPKMRIALDGTEGGSLARDEDAPLGPEDVRVASADGMLVLAVVGDSVRVRLGDSVTAKVQRSMQEGGDSGGIGGLIAHSVKGAVVGAMGQMSRFALRVPVSAVRDLRYEGGELSFRAGGKDSRVSARFAPAEAERFMRAVRARQGGQDAPDGG